MRDARWAKKGMEDVAEGLWIHFPKTRLRYCIRYGRQYHVLRNVMNAKGCHCFHYIPRLQKGTAQHAPNAANGF
jgi:hypothetical protein